MRAIGRHMKLVYSSFLACLAMACSLGDHAAAATVVAPNEFTNTEAPNITVGVFRGSNSDVAFQWILPASDFDTVPVGSSITAIGFRLNGSQSSSGGAASFGQWNLQLSSANNPSLTLSSIFADNIGPDVVTVRSGPLLIPSNAFPFGQSPNGFYDIPFFTPFVYQGGELVVTLRHTAHPGAQDLFDIDADAVSNNRGNSVGAAGFTATAGTAHFAHFPVTRFTIVPEPNGVLVGAFGIMGLATWSHCARGFSCKKCS